MVTSSMYKGYREQNAIDKLPRRRDSGSQFIAFFHATVFAESMAN